MYQRKVDVDMLNTVRSVLADVLSVSPLSALCFDKGLMLETSANSLFYGVQHIHINLTLIHCTYCILCIVHIVLYILYCIVHIVLYVLYCT